MKKSLKKINKIFDWSCKKTDVLKKYPSTFIKDNTEAIKHDWLQLGKTLKLAIDEYGKKNK